MGQGDFGGQDPNDQYMDMIAMMGGLRGMQPPGQGGASPDGGQEMAQRSLIQRLFGGGPQQGSMPGSPLLGQMPQDSAFNKLLPNHPRLAGALDSGALAASMVPQGETIGQNISGVAGAMTELPYARLMHAYQMLNPQLQAQMGVSQLGGAQAQTLEALARGQYYGGRNMSQVESARQRDLAETQARMQATASNLHPYVVETTAPEDDPHGRWKAGDTVVANRLSVPQGKGPDGSTTWGYKDEPFDTSKNYREQGGITNTGATNRPANQYMPGGIAGLILGANLHPEDPESAIILKAFGKYQSQLAAGAGQKTAAGQAAKTPHEQWTAGNADMDKEIADRLKANPLPTKIGDINQMAYADWLTDKERGKAGKSPMSLNNYTAMWLTDRKAKVDAITKAGGRYKKLAEGTDRPAPGDYLDQALSGGTAPTSGTSGALPPGWK